MDDESANIEHLRRALDGNDASWNYLVDAYSGLVWSVVRSYRMDSASQEDAYQATWLRLLDKGATVKNPSRLASWLITVAKRECLALLRTSSRVVPATDILDSMLPSSDLGSSLEQLEVGSGVRSAFERLDERCRLLLNLLIADPPVQYAAIGESLGLRIGSIGPTRQRCLDKLRKMLQETRIVDPPPSSDDRETKS